MAVNKVEYGDRTIIDITDTTAEAADVAQGKTFYGNDGVKRSGTGNYMDKVSNPTADDILVTDANGQAVDSGVSLDDVDDVFLVTYDENGSGLISSTPYADIYQAFIDEKDILFRRAFSLNQRYQPSFFSLGTNQAVVMRFLIGKDFVEYKVEPDETWTRTVIRTFTDTSDLADLATQTYVDTADANLQSQLGTLTDLTTDNKDNLVNAINEVYEKSGEPFRVKQWASSWSEGVAIEPCTTDKGNTSLAKMTFSIDAVEGTDYQIVGMIAYEVFDNVSGGNRLNVWPVCQFTGNGQKELSVRWVCAGTTVKTAKRINAWVLLKHR